MNLSDFSASALIAGFVFGVIGFSAFKRGKDQLNYPLLFIGIALMTYSMVVPGKVWPWIVGASLCGGAKHYWYN